MYSNEVFLDELFLAWRLSGASSPAFFSSSEWCSWNRLLCALIIHFVDFCHVLCPDIIVGCCMGRGQQVVRCTWRRQGCCWQGFSITRNGGSSCCYTGEVTACDGAELESTLLPHNRWECIAHATSRTVKMLL